MKDKIFDITATEIEERYRNMKPFSDVFTEEELDRIIKTMEEMALLPKEDLDKRQPGEKCMYELQRIENVKQK